MDSTFGWEDELNELMKSYAAELPSLLAQAETDAAFAEAEARAANSAGVNLNPIFGAIESFFYRFTQLERRIAELEARQKEEKLNGN